jgi:hypothetical protein
VVKDAVRAWKQSRQEVFLPLSHPAGEAQVDFGECTIRLAGQRVVLDGLGRRPKRVLSGREVERSIMSSLPERDDVRLLFVPRITCSHAGS